MKTNIIIKNKRYQLSEEIIGDENRYIFEFPKKDARYFGYRGPSLVLKKSGEICSPTGNIVGNKKDILVEVSVQKG
jgi:hypothetical protein